MWFFKKKKEKKVSVEEKQHVELKVEEPVKETPPQVSKPTQEVSKTVEKSGSSSEDVSKEKATKIPKYHVSQNKDDNTQNFKKWRVRKEGSTKTIKFFDTQKEAIDFAESLAESAGSSVVIHKIDGSIRKQDYTKKA
jgi:hypothetical protein